ncbi:MAG: hypothetical protein ACW99A_19720, partial [Candidatus Kariarchaeaceae archaeon]
IRTNCQNLQQIPYCKYLYNFDILSINNLGQDTEEDNNAHQSARKWLFFKDLLQKVATIYLGNKKTESERTRFHWVLNIC